MAISCAWAICLLMLPTERCCPVSRLSGNTNTAIYPRFPPSEPPIRLILQNGSSTRITDAYAVVHLPTGPCRSKDGWRGRHLILSQTFKGSPRGRRSPGIPVRKDGPPSVNGLVCH